MSWKLIVGESLPEKIKIARNKEQLIVLPIVSDEDLDIEWKCDNPDVLFKDQDEEKITVKVPADFQKSFFSIDYEIKSDPTVSHNIYAEVTGEKKEKKPVIKNKPIIAPAKIEAKKEAEKETKKDDTVSVFSNDGTLQEALSKIKKEQIVKITDSYTIDLGLSAFLDEIKIDWNSSSTRIFQNKQLLAKDKLKINTNELTTAFFTVKANIENNSSTINETVVFNFKNVKSNKPSSSEIRKPKSEEPKPKLEPKLKPQKEKISKPSPATSLNKILVNVKEIEYNIYCRKQGKIFQKLLIPNDKSIIVGKDSSKYDIPEIDLKQKFENPLNFKKCSRQHLKIFKTADKIMVENIGNKPVVIAGRNFTPGMKFDWNKNKRIIVIGDEIELILKD